MHLSRLLLNPLSREVRRALADSHRMHQLVMTGFADGQAPAARRAHHVLHRVDIEEHAGRIVLYVQSRSEPAWTRLPSGFLIEPDEGAVNPAVRSMAPVLESLRERTTLAFRLRANPTRRIAEGDDAGMRVALRRDADRRAWLERKAQEHGFEVVGDSLRVSSESRAFGIRAGVRVTHEGVRFDGVLRVTDVTRFRECLLAGIGAAKAYGFGLLTVSRPQR